MESSQAQKLRAALAHAVDVHRAGRLKQAETLYGTILKAHPDHLQALYLLGVLSLQRGAYAKAAGLLRKVLHRKPDHAEAAFSLGRALGALGRKKEAEEMFRACLSLAPGHADAWLSLGTAQQARGAYKEAEASFQKVLEIDPRSYRALANLGTLSMVFGRGSEGEAYLARAVALRPDDPLLLCNLAASHKGQGQLKMALETYERVLQADPKSVEALAGKANVLEKMGADQDALDLILPLVEAGCANPNVALTFATLADRCGRSDQALALLQEIAGRETTGTEQRCKLLFAQGRLLEQVGDYDRAFKAVAAANALVPRRFDVAAHDRRIDRIIEVYDRAAFAQMPRAGNDSELPLFVVGMPRSGKSLCEQILASHPAVFGTGELPYIDRAARSLAIDPDTQDGHLARMGEIARADLDRIAEAHLDKLRQRGGAAIRVTDTMPYNYLLLGFIAQLFPKARVVHCLRDPLDTCIACFFKDFRYANAQTTDLAYLGAYYRSYRRLMDHWTQVLDLPILTVTYEHLVADQETWSRRLVDFAGLEWDPSCLAFHQSRHAIESASYDVVREPLNSRWVGLWRHYDRHLGPLREALGKGP